MVRAQQMSWGNDQTGEESCPASDALRRRLRQLRISVTDHCNFRFTYCMPRATFGARHRFLSRPDLLSFEEIERLTSVFTRLGVEKVRLTGGEPTLRRDVAKLVEKLARIPALQEVNLTTNGSRLEEMPGPSQSSIPLTALSAADTLTFA